MHLIRFVLIEDSENDAKLLLRVLEKQGIQLKPSRIQTAEELKAHLEEGGWDLVISDYKLPHLNGLEALALVRSMDVHIPFIMVSGTAGEELAVTAMRLGANDFLSKDNLSRLAPIIEREMRDYALRKSQQAHADELRRLHMAISQVPDGIVISDPSGSILYTNPAMERISGYPSSEMLGRNPRIFNSGRHDHEFYRELWQTLENKETWRGVMVNRRKDGHIWEAEATISPVLDASGRLVSFVCTQRDVTRERLLQSQLEQSQRLEAIGVLTAGIAHDFNNVLTPILAHAEMGLMRENLDDELRRDLEVIAASTNRAATLSRQILGFTRKGGQDVQVLDFTALVKESLKLLRATIPSSIHFHVSLEGENNFVKGDVTQFHQIIVNLCANASHAMRGESGTLSVRLHRDALSETLCVMGLKLPPGEYVVLEVTDTGRGMSQETLSRIFVPFFTTKGPTEGTGLGLAIVLGIIHEMKGGVQVESEVGKGTCFRIFLPWIPDMLPFETAPNLEVPRGSERILLVDDEALLASSIRGLLESLGYKVFAYRKPLEALARLQEDPTACDLLITDHTMPHMTGLALTAQVKKIRPDLPVLLMTGTPNMDLGQVPSPVRPKGLLQKPIALRILAEIIREMLDH